MYTDKSQKFDNVWFEKLKVNIHMVFDYMNLNIAIFLSSRIKRI